MNARTARAAVAVVTLWAGLSSVAHAATRIVDVRFGGHAEFDRLVIEVDGELRAYHQPVRAGEVFVLELNAVPEEPVEVFHPALTRMGRVQIEGVADGALVRVEARPRRIRAFILAEPTRVIVDFANPGAEPLPIPEDAIRLLEAIAPPWTRAAPPDSGLPVAEPEPEPGELAAEAEPEPGERVTEPELGEPAAEPEPEISVAEVEPGDEPPSPTEPEPRPIPEPRPPVGELQPEPEPGPVGGLDRQVLTWSLAAVALFGAVALVVRRLRRRPPTREEPALASPPDTITPEDLGRGSGAREDRMLALESRLDDEVRSRTRVEDRLAQLHEDMKVVRDRLHRLARRDPGSGE